MSLIKMLKIRGPKMDHRLKVSFCDHRMYVVSPFILLSVKKPTFLTQ